MCASREWEGKGENWPALAFLFLSFFLSFEGHFACWLSIIVVIVIYHYHRRRRRRRFIAIPSQS